MVRLLTENWLGLPDNYSTDDLLSCIRDKGFEIRYYGSLITLYSRRKEVARTHLGTSQSFKQGLLLAARMAHLSLEDTVAEWLGLPADRNFPTEYRVDDFVAVLEDKGLMVRYENQEFSIWMRAPYARGKCIGRARRREDSESLAATLIRAASIARTTLEIDLAQ